MPSAAACRGRPLLALPLLALALLALIPTATADGPDCPTGTITLHLIAGNIQDPYAVCFPTFTVTVTESNNRCLLRVSPDAIANTLKWGNETDSNGAEDCPKSTATLQAFVADNTLDAVNAALLRAMRNASFSTSFLDGIEVQSNARIRAIMNTPGAGADLTYAVTSGTLSISGVDIQPGSNSDNACGTVNECKSNSAVNSPARYSVSIGNNQNIRALCPAGSSCNGSSRTACPAGQAATFVGSSACTSCAAGGYTDVAGSSHCTPCPGYSHAHFTGSTGCLACFFGEPRLVAGTLNGNNNPLFPNSMPSEQPSAGYRIYSVTSDIKTCSLGNSNPFRTCAASTANRMLAVETDATCVVRVYLLGDSACSKMDSVAVVQGAYRNLTHIESRGEDDSENDSVALALQAAVVGATNPSLRLTKGNDNCNTALARRGEGATGRNQCPEGTDIEDNKQGGNINPKACTPCDPGMQCGTDSNNRVADLCIPGTFSDVWGATQCQACTGLTAAITSGAVRCQECAAGTTPTNDKRSCQLCPAGQFSNVTGEACRNCPRGTFREANSGDGTECIPCSPGSFSANEGSGSCTDCALGRFATDEGSTSCSNCPRGSFANTTGSHECDTCEPGWFAANSGSATCTACPAGQITVASADAGATECRNCPRGTFRPANATDNKCQTCPAGWFTNNTAIGATACLPCPAGTFSQFPNSVSCTPCTGANYTDTQAARACKICPAGQVAVGPSGFAQGFPNGNSAASGSTRCLPCPRRTFRPSILSINTCTVCPAGRETRRNEGASICQACIPGFTLLNANDVNCTACNVGRFSDAPGRSGACPQCATGTFVADTGNQRCDVCAPGSYQDTTGQTACIECPVGTYSEMSGANSTSTCKPAPPGNFAEGTGNDGFTPCLAGTFQDKSGQGACKDCPPGNACPTGATNPRACAAGFFAEPKSPFCRECPKGQFQNLGRQRACKPCPAGRYCPNSKMTAGTLCPAGTFNRNVGQTLATACVKCPVNSFSATPGAQKCQPCSDLGSGRWTGRLTGQTTCWPTSQALPTNPQPAGGKNLGRRRS